MRSPTTYNSPSFTAHIWSQVSHRLAAEFALGGLSANQDLCKRLQTPSAKKKDQPVPPVPAT
jgi:hypothetical protein